MKTVTKATTTSAGLMYGRAIISIALLCAACGGGNTPPQGVYAASG